jgi:hypothetical protein
MITGHSIHGSTALVVLGRFFQFFNLYTVCRTLWTGDGRYLHTGQHKQNKSSQISMPRVRFEPTIPAFERAKTVYASDRAATVFGTDQSSELNTDKYV